MRRGSRGVVLTAAAVVLCLGTTGCAALGAGGTIRTGLRPGVDVPSSPGQVSDAPLGVPPVPPGGTGGYAFLRTHRNGSAVAFDPCRPVHYVVRPDGQPAEGEELLRWAFGEVSRATGLQFVDDGLTGEAPDPERATYQPEQYGDRWAPVLVAWSDEAESPLLAGRVLGRAGPDSFGTGEPGSERWVSGLAVFNGPVVAEQLRSGDDSKARAVLLHELGHLVGLAHVQDPYQVMYGANALPLSSYRAGDLRGLEQLGRGPCFRDF
jgi:hypothetical protein